MKVIVAGRACGKTTQMLEWMRAAPEGEHRVCVSASKEEAMRLLRENPDLESWQFVGPEDVKAGAWGAVLHGRGGRIALGVDNLDLLLARLFYWPVEAVSLTDPMSDAMSDGGPADDR